MWLLKWIKVHRWAAAGLVTVLMEKMLMRIGRRTGLLFLLGMVLAGCQTQPHRGTQVIAGQGDGDAMGTKAAGADLTPDMIYNLLLGEIASQRGDMERAFEHELAAAELTGDPAVAERAVRFAMHKEMFAEAMQAVDLWGRLAPNNLAAQQLSVVLHLKQDAEADVMPQLRKIVRISQDLGENGYLNAMAALNRELDAGIVLSRLRQLVAEFPDGPEGRYALAVSALMGKDHDSALVEAESLVDRFTRWPSGHLVLSRIHVSRGEKRKAREVLAEAVELLPNQPQLISAYARMLVDAKDMQGAYRQFRRLLNIEPEDEAANYWLGLISLEQKKTDEAKGYFDTLVQLNKRTEAAAYFLGMIEEDANHVEKAIDWYKQVDRGEYREQALVRMVRLLAVQSRLIEAREWLQGLRIQRPKQAVRLYLLESDLLKEYGAPADVMALLDESLQAYPEENDLLYARGLFAVSQNRLDIMEQDLRKVLAQDPQHADALNALGYTLADQTDRYTEALDLITQALALKPDAPAVMDSMGWIQYRLGNHEKALEFLWRAYEKLPDSEIAAHLGEVLWITGERDQAEKIWQGALEVSPQSEHVLEAMRRLKP